METMEKKHVDYTYNKMELENKVIETIDKIKEWCKKNDYRIEGFPLTLNLHKNDHVSKTQMKKINKSIVRLDKRITMKQANRFFHLLTKICDSNPVRIKCPEKEEKIQMARKRMLKAKEIYETLLKEYKEEKGDYYKTRKIV